MINEALRVDGTEDIKVSWPSGITATGQQVEMLQTAAARQLSHRPGNV